MNNVFARVIYGSMTCGERARSGPDRVCVDVGLISLSLISGINGIATAVNHYLATSAGRSRNHMNRAMLTEIREQRAGLNVKWRNSEPSPAPRRSSFPKPEE